MTFDKKLEKLEGALERVSRLLPEVLSGLFTLGVLALIGLDVMMAIGGSSAHPPDHRIESPRRIENHGITVQPGRSGSSEGCSVMPDGTRICNPPDQVLR